MSSLIDCQMAVYFDPYSVYSRVVMMDMWIDHLKGSPRAVKMPFCLEFQYGFNVGVLLGYELIDGLSDG